MNGLADMKHSRFAMIVMFLVAVGMLIGTITVFTQAYHQSTINAEVRAASPVAPPPPSMPGEKPKEPEPPKPASFGEAFSIASTNPFFWWTLINSVVMAGMGLFFLTRRPVATLSSEQQREDRQWSKLGYFGMLSLMGFITVVCVAIPYTWMMSNELLSRQGWTSAKPWLIVLAYALGLGSMFASILAIKSEERNNVTLRRWIYGYNAFLGALLFLSILSVLNAWFALYGPEPSDWTGTNLYSLSPATKRLVKSLDKPVRVVAMLRPSTPLSDDIHNTLNSIKSQSNQIEIVDLPYAQRNVKELNEVIKKYGLFDMTEGILLIQDPAGDKPLTTFLKKDDLETERPDAAGGGSQRSYKGEQAIFAALRDFRQEKKKPMVYVTQDSGELSIDETRARGNTLESRSIVGLKMRMEKAGYQVKPWNLGQLEADGKTLSKIPDDGMLVIVADPLRITPEKVSVLDAYMKRPKKSDVEPGKLIVFVSPHFGQDGKVLPTGLESLLGVFGVQVVPDVLFTISRTDPTRVTIAPASMVVNMPTDPELTQSLESLFKTISKDLEFRETRSVKTIPANIAFDTKPLLMAVAQDIPTQNGRRMLVWPEDRNIPQPIEYLQKLIESKEYLKKLDSPIPPTVAVTVRDRSANQPPPDPRMPVPQGKLGEPRMAVFGNAAFITDSEMQNSGSLGANIILSTLAWSRGKPEIDSGDVTPKERKAYHLSMSNDTLNRLIWLPVLWLLVSVILIGVGVAVLRRQ
ncbi:MAG TPA: Gldg family protein [Gemmatales bacterium]|nr:Gldg family protein [Gemmatales bacterium]